MSKLGEWEGGRPGALGAGGLLCMLLATVCGACEPGGFRDRMVALDELPDNGATPSGAWQSAPFPTPGECDGLEEGGGATSWMDFGGRQTVEIAHGLGRVPSQVTLFIAFDPRGCRSTLASGDVARINGVDAERIVVENATTQAFSLRLLLQ